MGYISVNNTFVAAADLDATEVNDNFNDIINGLTDSTKDVKVATITSISVSAAKDVDADTLSCDSITTKNLTMSTSTLGTIFFTTLELAPIDATIAAGVLSPTTSSTFVNGEGGLADDLNTITAAATSGTLLTLFKKSTSGTITIKHNVDNILCGSDKVLTANSVALFLYDGVTSKWNLLFFQTN